MKRAILVLMVMSLLSGSLLISGCDERNADSDEKQAERTEEMMQEAWSQVGMPAISNFKELKDAKMIMELRDQEDFMTYAYFWNEFNGELIYVGRSMGYGLPFSTQMTSPRKLESRRWGAGNRYVLSMPQPEPMGLFLPDNVDATWLMVPDEDGDVRPLYVEQTLTVSPFPLHAPGTKSLVEIGAGL